MDYSSPRWTNELADCSMPMTFDTYSKCAFNCLYCFAFFQKSHTLDGYIGGKVRCVDPEKVKRLFIRAMNNDPNGTDGEKQFYRYIQDRKIMQWGGMADEFDEWERRFGITLELLHFFDEIDYPLSFSTKATWWTKDPRYMDIFKRHTHNWHVKISIITANGERARKIERGVPPPDERLAAIKRLADIGIHVTLRLRPYVIGISQDWKTLITKAHEAGADSVTTEFFCMESRADERLKARYRDMSAVCGFDIFRYYMSHSEQMGYKRLNRAIKAPIIHRMRDYAHSLGMRFHVSDAFCRECNDACNCCGVPPEWDVSQKCNLGQAIIIAREKGVVRWSDISPGIERYFSTFRFLRAQGFNTGTNMTKAKNYRKTMYDYLHRNWNNVNGGISPAKGYGGILVPSGVD